VDIDKDHMLVDLIRGPQDFISDKRKFVRFLVCRLRQLDKQDGVFIGGKREGKSEAGALLTNFARLIMEWLRVEITRDERWQLPIFEDANLEKLMTHKEFKKFVRAVRGYLWWLQGQTLRQRFARRSKKG